MNTLNLVPPLALLVSSLVPLASAQPAESQAHGYETRTNILYRTEQQLTDYMRERCRLDVYSPAGATGFATVVWFHGGGMTNGNRFIPDGLKEKGIAVVAASYRLSPRAKSPAYVEDAAAAVAWTFRHIGEYGGATNRIFVSGHSAGGYLASMVGMDKRWLSALGLDADGIAGLIPFSGQAITHFTIRSERGIDSRQPIVDDMAPLYHVRKDAPPLLLLTGDRELELLGRYEENAYLWRMMKETGHPNTKLQELKGFDHGQMAQPAFPLLLQFVQQIHVAPVSRAAGELPGSERSTASATSSLGSATTPSTFALETFARRNLNYLNRMVDTNGLPYFNIFWSDPAEAAHDWPDFGDVMARQYQAVIMARHMTGERSPIEAIWRRKLVELIDPETGLLTRPQTSFSQKVADPGDQALTLYALVTAYVDSPEENLKQAILKMTARLLAQAEQGKSGADGFLNGFMIKSLMASVRALHDQNALKLARAQVQKVFVKSPLFSSDNNFRHGGHMHGNLRTLVGAADYALYAGDPVLFSRVDALYRYVRSEATSFGFLPEVIGRQGDVVATETCALMDYVGLAVTLANHGHPEYWGDVERVVRNQLAESQATDLPWLKTVAGKIDTEQFTWTDLPTRLAGGYAGWSSPTHFLATCETLHWGGPELRGKTRVFQNCCGGSGTHGFFIAWKNAATFENGTLSVNLHVDKLLPQAEIRGFQPFAGRLTIRLTTDCAVRVRIPDFVEPRDLKAEAGGAAVASRVWGNYAELGRHPQGTILTLTYPLTSRTEEIQIGNPGFRHYRYRVHWRGDTVMEMEPLGNDYSTGYSDFEKKEVPVFYGKAGPGPLYQRAALLKAASPDLTPLQEDDGKLNFWAGLEMPPAQGLSIPKKP